MSHYTQYKSNDPAQINAVIAAYPFAVITKNNEQTGYSDHVRAPVIKNTENSYWEFHMAKANPAYENFKNGGKITCAFTGPNGHISPSSYKTRFEDKPRDKTAPTWNYVAADIWGKAIPMNTATFKTHLETLVTFFEGTVEDGWSFDELAPDTLNSWMSHIAGFYIEPEKQDATFKLSQENEQDLNSIISDLKSRNTGFDGHLADYMQRFYS